MKLWNVNYTYEGQSTLEFFDGVVVVADSFEEAINIVETKPEVNQRNIKVFSISQETKRILTA